MQNSCHSWSSLLKVRSKFWSLHFFGLRSSKLLHLVLNGCSRNAFGTPPDRAGDAPGRPRALLGRPGTPQEGPRTDFWSILGAPRTKIASNFIKVWTEIRSYVDGNSIKDRPKIDQDWIEVRSKFDSDQKSWSRLLIDFLDQISWSNFLIKFLDQNCWSNFLITFVDLPFWSWSLFVQIFFLD